jgi:hypothetical protein
MTTSYHSDPEPPQSEGLLPATGSNQVVAQSDSVQTHEFIGPPWATAFWADDSVLWWTYETETQVDFENFEHPGEKPHTVIVRLERADGYERKFLPPSPGVPAAVETTIEQGQDMVVIDVMRMDDRPFPELRMTRRQAEQLGKALAEAVTVHYERTVDVFPGRAGRSPIGDES